MYRMIAAGAAAVLGLGTLIIQKISSKREKKKLETAKDELQTQLNDLTKEKAALEETANDLQTQVDELTKEMEAQERAKRLQKNRLQHVTDMDTAFDAAEAFSPFTPQQPANAEEDPKATADD